MAFTSILKGLKQAAKSAQVNHPPKFPIAGQQTVRHEGRFAPRDKIANPGPVGRSPINTEAPRHKRPAHYSTELIGPRTKDFTGGPTNQGMPSGRAMSYGSASPSWIGSGPTRSALPAQNRGSGGFGSARAGADTALDGRQPLSFMNQKQWAGGLPQVGTRSPSPSVGAKPPTGGSPSMAGYSKSKPTLGAPVTGAGKAGINLNPAAAKTVSGLPLWGRVLAAAGPAWIGAELAGPKLGEAVGSTLGLPEWVYSDDPEAIQARVDDKAREAQIAEPGGEIESDMYDNRIDNDVRGLGRGFFEDPASSTGWSYSNGKGQVAMGVKVPGMVGFGKQGQAVHNKVLTGLGGEARSIANVDPEDIYVNAPTGFDMNPMMQPHGPEVAARPDQRNVGPTQTYYDPNI